MIDITNPIFNDENKAREYLEAQRWPNGAICPFCKKQGTVKALPAEAMMSKPSKKNPISKPTPGYYHCRQCRKKFTVCTGSVMERSHIPLAKWVLAFRLMGASKKGMSALQLQRMLGVQYKTAWFLEMRIREAMTPDEAESGPIGGGNKVVESDETYAGGKKKNVHNGKPEPKKHAVVTLVERSGEVRAKHVANVTAKNVKEHLQTNVDKASWLMTDDSKIYVTPGKSFAGHSSVNHSEEEYVRLGGFVHVNTAESFHAIIKRQMYGTRHAVSEHHLQRYINEIAFKWNHRVALGVDDTARTIAAIKGAEGKRLTYRRTDTATQA
jgi:transposase-like protein